MLLYVLLALCVILVLLLSRRRNDYWKKRNVVQVDGTFWKFLTGDRSLPEYYKEVYDTNDENAGIFVGSKPALVLKDLEDVQAVLAGDFQNFYKRGILYNPNDLLADNILLIDDYKRWKCLRHKLSPVFTSAKLKHMFYIFDKCARDFVDFMQENPEMQKKPFNALYTYTTASVSSTIFGLDMEAKNTMDSPFLEMSWKALKPSLRTIAITSLSATFPKIFKLLKLKIVGEHEDFFIGAVKQVMELRRKETEKRHDFIETCLELQKNGMMTDPLTGYEVEPTTEILAAQAFFFFIAGIETSANTMHFALLLLAGHQDILAKVHAEIDEIFHGKEELTYSDVEKMQYLDMVLNESMRIYPSVGSINRLCTKDTVLPGSKIKVEKDVMVIIPVFGIQRDKNLFPDPDKFDPERFAAKNLSELKKFSYLPFGEGNRICIGNRFARLQLKAGLAWLLRRFTLAESHYNPKHFERSTFSLRDTEARYDLIPRNIKN